jgi:hypothetical protein
MNVDIFIAPTGPHRNVILFYPGDCWSDAGGALPSRRVAADQIAAYLACMGVAAEQIACAVARLETGESASLREITVPLELDRL